MSPQGDTGASRSSPNPSLQKKEDHEKNEGESDEEDLRKGPRGAFDIILGHRRHLPQSKMVSISKWTFTVYQSFRTGETLLRLPFELGVDAEAFVAKISKTGSLAGSKVASMVPFFRGTQ